MSDQPPAQQLNTNNGTANATDDIDVAEWKRSRVNDEVMISFGNSSTSQSRDGRTASHQQVTYIVVEGTAASLPLGASVTHPNPIGAGVNSSLTSASGVRGNFSGNGLSTAGMAGSISRVAVEGGSGSYMASAGGSCGAPMVGGGSDQVPSPGALTNAHVRTITIHPASSHNSDPSSSSGIGSTNDYYPVFVAGQSERASAADPAEGHSGTTDASSSHGRHMMLQQQQYQYMLHQQTGVSHGASAHVLHQVMLPDGSVVAPHGLQSHHLNPSSPSGVLSGGTVVVDPSTGRPVLSAGQGYASPNTNQNEMGRSLGGASAGGGSSTTTNAAVWGGSASAAKQFAVNGSASAAVVPQHVVVMQPSTSGMPGVYDVNASQQPSVQAGPQHFAPHTLPSHVAPNAASIGARSQFIGGRGRGGMQQRGGAVGGAPPSTFGAPTTNAFQATAPMPATGARGAMIGGSGRGGVSVRGRAGVVLPAGAALPPAMHPQVPMLGKAPTILIGKLPTPTFTQTVSVGGLKLGTTNLVAPRVPGQGEGVAVGRSPHPAPAAAQ